MKVTMIFGITLMSLFTSVFAQLATADEIAKDRIVKHSDGSIAYLPLSQAKAFCDEHGLHLPTAREVALLAQSLGAKGILETSFTDISVKMNEVKTEILEKKAQGYYPIYKLNSQRQTVVDFYYSEEGYVRPEGDTGKYWFWTYSLQPADKNYAYVLISTNGRITSDYNPVMYAGAAVRCRH